MLYKVGYLAQELSGILLSPSATVLSCYRSTGGCRPTQFYVRSGIQAQGFTLAQQAAYSLHTQLASQLGGRSPQNTQKS